MSRHFWQTLAVLTALVLIVLWLRLAADNLPLIVIADSNLGAIAVQKQLGDAALLMAALSFAVLLWVMGIFGRTTGKWIGITVLLAAFILGGYIMSPTARKLSAGPDLYWTVTFGFGVLVLGWLGLSDDDTLPSNSP